MRGSKYVLCLVRGSCKAENKLRASALCDDATFRTIETPGLVCDNKISWITQGVCCLWTSPIRTATSSIHTPHRPVELQRLLSHLFEYKSKQQSIL